MAGSFLAYRRWYKPILFRLGAILIGLSPLLVLEAGLRIAVWAPSIQLADDPFVEFHGQRPLFVANAEGDRMEIAENRLTFFRPESFAADKPQDEYRIFVLGGSTVQGRPYAIETSFTTWLELSLQAAMPGRRWEVVNCGGVSYASYRLTPIMRELVGYQPDLFILYTGHNEFLEDRTYDHVTGSPTWLTRFGVALAKLKSYSFLRQLIQPLAGELGGPPTRARLAEEVDALLDYRGGLEAYRRDDRWRQGVIDHFEFNLRRMIGIAADAGVPLVMINPACNLKDCPPFKVADTDEISAADAERSLQLWQRAQALDNSQNSQAIELLSQAATLNERHAGIHYLLADVYARSGQPQLALQHYRRARDEDLCPLRILTPMQEIIHQSARQTGTPMIDAAELFRQLSDEGMVGDRWFLDHVHPTIAGHQQIAAAIVDHLIAQQIVSPRDGWEAERERLFQQHQQSLDVVYFERGKQRLAGLRRWTQGRAHKIKGDIESGEQGE